MLSFYFWYQIISETMKYSKSNSWIWRVNRHSQLLQNINNIDLKSNLLQDLNEPVLGSSLSPMNERQGALLLRSIISYIWINKRMKIHRCFAQYWIKIVYSVIHFMQTRSHGWYIFNNKSRKIFNIQLTMR